MDSMIVCESIVMDSIQRQSVVDGISPFFPIAKFLGTLGPSISCLKMKAIDARIT